ncbi:MAG: bifunctional 5,10-methylenetetrahydrofolate dehydrogenase/5,10-methenyltetrahydrofolate cyclohydrolase [Alphaproteobacteria bacterium]
MQTQMIDGKKLAIEKRAELKKRVEQLLTPPHLDVIWVGNNPASQVYVRHKEQAGASIGIQVTVHHLPESTPELEILELIGRLNQSAEVDGILVQLPLPKHITESNVLEAIEAAKDVDGLTTFNLGHLLSGQPQMVPCTPQACMALIETVEPNLEGKLAVVVGRSRLVGKPLFQLLLAKHCTVVQAHSKTQNLTTLTRMADILVVATGHAGLIGGADIKPGAIVIDVGITKQSDGTLVGDVKTEDVKGIAAAITPVPGGVGPMTVAMLLENVVRAAELKQNPRIED